MYGPPDPYQYVMGLQHCLKDHQEKTWHSNWTVLCIYLFIYIFIYLFIYLYIYFVVRGSRPGKTVQMSEAEVRGLCLKSRELFLQQPILLELEAPLKICGKSPGVKVPWELFLQLPHPPWAGGSTQNMR